MVGKIVMLVAGIMVIVIAASYGQQMIEKTRLMDEKTQLEVENLLLRLCIKENDYFAREGKYSQNHNLFIAVPKNFPYKIEVIPFLSDEFQGCVFKATLLKKKGLFPSVISVNQYGTVFRREIHPSKIR